MRSDSSLGAVTKCFPELLAFARSTIGQASVLQLNDLMLQSAEDVQRVQVGSLYFCLTFKELLDSLRSEHVPVFLDDLALGDEAACVIKYFSLLGAVES